MRTWGTAVADKDLADFVGATFASEVRIVGAGAIAIAAIWTFLKILGPIVTGIRESLASSAKRDAGEEIPLTERDLSMKTVIGVTVGSMLPIGVLLWLFLHGTSMAHHATGLIIISILFILLTGLVVASVCGYMAGLIGSSNSPVSGVGLLVVVITAVVILAVHGRGSTTEENTALIAYTLFTSAIVFCIATIANDNLQDLKTGQLVGATPWKQQVALVIGVVFGALIIPPVLELMQNSFGFQGAPGAGPDALAAPQASLISSLAKGVLGGGIDWKLLGIGAAIGVVVIIIDEVLRPASKGKLALPPLAVGMGIYLPASLTVLIPIGALIGFLYNRWADKQVDVERAKRFGTLAATGLIVGESLFGVVYAGIAGVLKAKTGANEVIVTIMLNSIATLGLGYTLAQKAWQVPGTNQPVTPKVAESAALARLLPAPFKLHVGFLVALVALVAFWWLIERSTLGFQIRAVGANAAAARTAGISVERITAITMVLSGAFLGLAGANEALGTIGYVSRDVAGSIGFDAITVALLGRNKTWGTFGAGLLFGAFKAGGYTMQAKGVPIDMILILQSVIVLLIAAPALVRWLFRLPDVRALAANTRKENADEHK